jgi:hypothetical protein
MKRAFLLVFLLNACCPFLVAQIGIYQHGSVVRMHMGECVLSRHAFMTAFGGPAVPVTQELCPEYTLMSEKVVFVIVGKSTNQLIPLAENIDFRLHNNELAVRVDDAKRESKFTIREMILRPEWERARQHAEERMSASYNPATYGDTGSRNRP